VSAPITVVPLAMNVVTDQASYSSGSFVRITSTVTAGTAWAVGASVTYTITRPDGRTVTSSATTGTSGTATMSLRVKNNDPKGTYQVNGTATLNGSTTSDTTSYTVQ
jgi:hypothetical protein